MSTLTSPRALDQRPERVDMAWAVGDAFSMQFTVIGGATAWVGTYTAEIRKRPLDTSPVLATPTVTAAVDGDDAVVTVTLADTSALTPGRYWWSAAEDGPLTRIAGQVVVSTIA